MMDRRVIKLMLFVQLLAHQQVSSSEVEENTASDAYKFRTLLNLDTSRSSTSSKFIPGPNGEHCILSDRHLQDRRYEKRDDQGWCCCSLCNPGSYAKKLCVCGGLNGTPTEFTDCEFVKQGIEFMNKTNKCSQPYNCSSSCGNHQIKVTDCSAESDIKCECEDGWYDPYPSEIGMGPRECRRRPLCPKGQGQERQIIAFTGETGEVVFICQPCREGYYQDLNNSTASCQPHRQCLVQAGSAVADNVCLNDQPLANLSSNATAEPSSPEPTDTDVTQTDKTKEENLPTTPTDREIPVNTPENIPVNCTSQPDIEHVDYKIIAIVGWTVAAILLIILISYLVFNKCKAKKNHQVSYTAASQQVGFPSGN